MSRFNSSVRPSHRYIKDSEIQEMKERLIKEYEAGTFSQGFFYQSTEEMCWNYDIANYLKDKLDFEIQVLLLSMNAFCVYFEYKEEE